MRLEPLGIRVCVARPSGREEAIVRHHPAACRDQRREQRELGSGQGKRRPLDGSFVTPRVERQPAHVHATGGRLPGFVPSHDRPDSRQELLLAERLRDVVIGARVERLHLGQLVRLACEDDDRGLAGSPDLATDIHAITARHREIEENEIGRLLLEPAQGGLTVVRGDHLVPGCPHERRDRPDHGRLVVDHEDPQPGCLRERHPFLSHQAGATAGSATTKRLPPKPFPSIQILPPIASIRRRAAYNPIPEPRPRRPLARTNASKTDSQSSAGTPGPSSVM